MDTIPLNRPDIRSHEAVALQAALDGLQRGDRSAVDMLEEAACRAVQRPYAVAASSAGIAMEAAMLALDLKPGEEVACSAYAPARLVAGIVRVGAVPKFVDAQPRTASIDPERLETAIGERTRAIAVAPSWFDPDILQTLASMSRKFEIPLIEDAVESLGSTISSDAAGAFGRLSVIGLGSESPACAAGGGIIVTNDERLAAAARTILIEGKASSDDPDDLAPGGFVHHRVGVDGRLDPLRAAVAIGVLERLEDTIAERRAIAERYIAQLGGEADLQIPASAVVASPSWPAFPVRLDERFVHDDRDAIIAGLRRHDIVAAAGWSLGPTLPIVERHGYGSSAEAWPIAGRLAARTIHLPCHPGMTERDVDLVCQTLLLMMKQTVFSRHDD